jgi:hypothetical protein
VPPPIVKQKEEKLKEIKDEVQNSVGDDST